MGCADPGSEVALMLSGLTNDQPRGPRLTEESRERGCFRHLGEASPSEFVVAHEDLLPELVGGTPSPFSDLLETRACILGYSVAVCEAKHIRPTRQDSPRETRKLQQQRPHCPQRIVSEAFYSDYDSLGPHDRG